MSKPPKKIHLQLPITSKPEYPLTGQGHRHSHASKLAEKRNFALLQLVKLQVANLKMYTVVKDAFVDHHLSQDVDTDGDCSIYQATGSLCPV